MEKNDIIYVYLSQNQGKLVTKVNGNIVKTFDSLGNNLSYFFKDKKDDTNLYIVFEDGVAFSDVENIIGVAQAIGYLNIRLYALNLKNGETREINQGHRILSFIINQVNRIIIEARKKGLPT